MTGFSELLNGIRSYMSAYKNAFAEAARQYSLTQNEIDVLLFLYNNAPYDTARDIVEMRRLSKSHVCMSVDSLVSRGFICGRRGESDRRCVHLRITEAGEPVAARLKEIQSGFLRRMKRGISEAELKSAFTVAEKAFRNLKEENVK